MNSHQAEPAPTKAGNEPGSEIPNGPAAAAILSAGAGCFFVSFFALLGDAFPAVARCFNFYHPTGPLSGVTTTAIILWLGLWAVLARAWGGRTFSTGKIFTLSFLLLGAGLVLSFPPLGDLLQGK